MAYTSTVRTHAPPFEAVRLTNSLRDAIGASLLEFRAIPAFSGICYLRYLKKSPRLADFRSVQAIAASARSTITAFLELPETVVANLTMPSFMTLWYCLLMLCKLTVLTPWLDRGGLERSHVRQCILAIVSRFAHISRGDDFWARSTRVISELVPWLDEQLADGNRNPSSVALPHPVDGPQATDSASDESPAGNPLRRSGWDGRVRICSGIRRRSRYM